MRRSSRDDYDEESVQPVNFTDETLPVVSCKEAAQKDPVFVSRR